MRRPALNMVALPTLVTLGNTFCGFLATTYLLEAAMEAGQAGGPGAHRAAVYDYLARAVWAMLLAMVFDFMDGKVARLTGSESAFGVQIDSLSDVLSFGLCPALMFKVMAEYEFHMSPKGSLVLACFYLFGAVLRLARFNVEADLEHDDHKSFKGMPSPAAAAGVASVVFLYASREYPWMDAHIRIGFPWVVTSLGILMWTKLPYIHFANVLLTEKRQPWQLLIIIGAIGLTAVEPALTIAILMMAYALSGPTLYVWNLVTGRSTVDGESFL
ncbi:MAG: CDP-diacylglycerol--serine O-phosphatidyltransferase [Planctomycetes bacterium]|nr:CDP-diacylglycerol--serine O-phosphatidyltransferase [Planctomycetota bacterium]